MHDNRIKARLLHLFMEARFCACLPHLFTEARFSVGSTHRFRFGICGLFCIRALSFFLIAGLSVFSLNPSIAGETYVRPQLALSVIVTDGRLWATLRDAPIKDTIRAIGESAPFDVEFHGELTSTVSKHFHGMPLIDALNRILENNSWIGKYDRTGRIIRLNVYGTPQVAKGGNSPRSPEADESKVGPPETARSETQLDPATRWNRLETIQKLAREQPDGAANALASMLVEDEDPVLRWNAAIALADIPDHLASQVLVDTLVNYADEPTVRRLAAWALGRRQDSSAAWALQAATFDFDLEVRQASLDALKAIHRQVDDHDREQRLGPTVQ